MKHLLILGLTFAAFHISHSKTPDFCYLAHDEGNGPQFMFAFFYNAAKDQCDPFIYKGNGGNANRFESERQCIRNCSANVDNIYPIDERSACTFKKAIGECGGQFLRYYYDAVHDKCKKFIYSGCIGNGNRFTDNSTCYATCAGVHNDGDELEEDEPDTPIAIICGVLLAVIITAIIITVVVLTVQSKKKSKKMTPGKSKAETPIREQGIEME